MSRDSEVREAAKVDAALRAQRTRLGQQIERIATRAHKGFVGTDNQLILRTDALRFVRGTAFDRDLDRWMADPEFAAEYRAEYRAILDRSSEAAPVVGLSEAAVTDAIRAALIEAGLGSGASLGVPERIGPLVAARLTQTRTPGEAE